MGSFCSLDGASAAESQTSVFKEWQQFSVSYREYVLSAWTTVHLTNKAKVSRDRLIYRAGCVGERLGVRGAFHTHARLMANYADAKLESAQGSAALWRKTLLGPDRRRMCKAVACSNEEWMTYLRAAIAMVDGLSMDLVHGSIPPKRSRLIFRFHLAAQSLGGRDEKSPSKN